MKTQTKSLYLLTLVLFLSILWAWTTTVDVAVEATGTIRPRGDPTKLIAEVGGLITRANLKEGQKVKRGDPLIQLDARELYLKQRSLQIRIHETETKPAQSSELANLYLEMERTNLEITRLTITSPTAGVISAAAPTHEGEILAQGTALATILPEDPELILESWLPATERQWLCEGQRVTLELKNAILTGAIKAISPDARIAEGRPAYRVTTELDEPEDLKPGMTFRVHFITRQARLLTLLFDRLF